MSEKSTAASSPWIKPKMPEKKWEQRETEQLSRLRGEATVHIPGYLRSGSIKGQDR